ncbi:MAG TPA: TIGR01777 family oxidoreductase [Polyangiaceae bacterium]|nr:TIGR01777 family oxidoreductase [Polyangiaceae bacterium]
MAKVKAVIAGGTGFIGRQLVAALLDRHDAVTVITRGGSAARHAIDSRAATATWEGDWRDAVVEADAVVNLSGEGILDQRWTQARLRALRESRTKTTERLALALADSKRTSATLVSASAVGYYGMRRDDAVLDESSPPGDDVLARLCVDWEAAAEPARAAGRRVCHPRIGIVLGREGGALGRLLPMFRRFLGGPLGDGKQWWSWIHEQDVVRAILFAVDTPDFTGPFNVTAPAPATMNEVALLLGEVLSRPSALRVPAFTLRVALGEAAEVLLTGQRALPKKLEQAGFSFSFPRLEAALRDLVC